MRIRRPNSRFSLTRLASLAMTATAAVVMTVVTALALISPRPAHADHDSLYVICPDPILEGNTGQMGIRRSGYKIKSATFFTDHRYHTADSDDYEEYHGFKIESGSGGGDTTLWGPIVTKEDSLPEHDETFAMGFWDGGVWHQCVVTIEDDDAPEITHVEIASTPVDLYAYRAGEAIDVTVNMDAKVDVEKGSMVALFLGDEAESTWRGASYHSGSGSRSLVFRYRVKLEDMDNDGINVSAAAVSDDRSPAYGFSGNIYAQGTDVPIDYTHSGVAGGWRQKVDGRPYVRSARITSSPDDGWQAYRANQTIEITLAFDTDVVVEGDVSIDLYLGLEDYNWDEAARQASYFRGSGTDTLVFGYTVRPGDMDPKGIGLVMGNGDTGAGFGGEGTIKAKGTDVERNPWYRGTGHQPDHKVDTEPPTVSSVSFTSQPANGETYDSGETISVAVVLSEETTASGNPGLDLDVGGESRQATLQGVPEGTFTRSLVFNYTVRDGDADTDGIGIGANSLKLNGGGIRDIAGNSADQSHDAVAADPGHKVDTSS